MKWVVVAIIACIIPYTWITLAYRKEVPAYEPYQDNKDRAQVLRLLDNGFHRFAVSLELLTDPAAPPDTVASVERIDGGLPPLLREVLIDSPPLPDRLPLVVAPAEGLAAAPYAFTFACTQPAADERPATVTLYQQGDQLTFVVAYEDLPGDLQTRRLDATGRITVPARLVEPGTYQATLLGTRESRRWTITLH